MYFIQTCCRILKADKKEKIDNIRKKALDDGKGKVQATMGAIRRLLDELGKEAVS